MSVAGLLAACGSNAASSGTAAQSPGQSIRLAAASLTAGSYRMSASASLAIDASGVSGPLASHITAGAQQSGTQSMQEQFRDSRDLSATVTSAGHKLHLVVYAGTAYVSADGQNYKSAPFITNLVDQLSASQVQGYAAHLQGTVDKGESTQDGVATEQYSSTVDPAYLSSLLNKILSSLVGSVGSTAIPAGVVSGMLAVMHFKTINLTWYVNRSSGRLVREVTQGDIGVDVGGFVAAIAGAAHATPPASASAGTLVLHETYDAHFSGWGDRIVVSKPNVTGSLTLPEFGQLLLQAPAAS